MRNPFLNLVVAASLSILPFSKLGAQAPALPDDLNLVFSTQEIAAPPCYQVPKLVLGALVS